MKTDDNTTACTEPDKGGRPSWQPTRKHRDDCKLYVATGMSEADIARVFGVSHMTLRKHLSEELQNGRAEKRAEVIGYLQKSAKAGNVSAQKHLEMMTGAVASSREEMARKMPALGKKEQARDAAQHPDTSTPLGDLMVKRSTDAVN